MTNLLKSVCEHFSLGSMPFLQRSKIPYENDNLKLNLPLVSSAFFSRQLVVIIGMPGSGKSSLLFYAVNELDPSSFRICHIELSNQTRKHYTKPLLSRWDYRLYITPMILSFK